MEHPWCACIDCHIIWQTHFLVISFIDKKSLVALVIRAWSLVKNNCYLQFRVSNSHRLISYFSTYEIVRSAFAIYDFCLYYCGCGGLIILQPDCQNYISTYFSAKRN